MTDRNIPSKDVAADTGHAEADRILGRLASSDTDFDDCADAAVLIRKLVAELNGPDGFATWKDAAIAERMRRVAGETTAFRLLPIERDELVRWHTMCAQVSAQTDDFAGARRHRERLAELTHQAAKVCAECHSPAPYHMGICSQFVPAQVKTSTEPAS